MAHARRSGHADGTRSLVAPSCSRALRRNRGGSGGLRGTLASHAGRPTRAAALAGGAALVVITIPGFAVDLARYGPQVPLMVGLMCGGGAVLALSVDRALHARA